MIPDISHKSQVGIYRDFEFNHAFTIYIYKQTSILEIAKALIHYAPTLRTIITHIGEQLIMHETVN